MILAFNITAICAALAVGIGVFVSNPVRGINRAFFVLSAFVTIWLVSMAWLTSPNNGDPIFWLRVTSALAGFFPWFLWIVKSAAKGEAFEFSKIKEGWPWLLGGILLCIDVYTPFFIPPESTPQHPMHGLGWTAYYAVLGIGFVLLLLQAIGDLRTLKGIHRVELQTLLIGSSAAGLLGIGTVTLGPVLGLASLTRTMLPFIIVGFYAVTAWAITTQKVFDARHLFQSGLRMMVFLIVVGIVIGLGINIGARYLPSTSVVVLCTAVIGFLLHLMDRQSWFRGRGDRGVEMARSEMLSVSRETLDLNILEGKVSDILNRWGRTEHSYILKGSSNGFVSDAIRLRGNDPALAELTSTGWATPESLSRQRPSLGRKLLSQFMERNRLGVLVAGPMGGGLHPLIFAQEVRHDRRPFIWPEVQLLQEWIAIIEGAFSRLALAQHARDSEQLATAGLLGASLAHEIRNPLVTIKLIVQSAKDRFYEPDFRRLFTEVVPGELERIESLVEGLMDLGKPRHPKLETVRLNEVVETSLKLVQAKADKDMVALTYNPNANPDELSADKGSLRQVTLNLVMNAIDAVAMVDGKREVSVQTSAKDDSVILEVSDTGPGVPLSVKQRLFRPFTTSNKTSGIGLGLAITAEIVRAHNGQIILLDDGRAGATFRVTLPCRQPSF